MYASTVTILMVTGTKSGYVSINDGDDHNWSCRRKRRNVGADGPNNARLRFAGSYYLALNAGGHSVSPGYPSRKTPSLSVCTTT